jgi:hypothetical protein
MEIIAYVMVALVVMAVMFKLGLFNPIVELSAVATRESSAYNREHKARVAKRYENLVTDVDLEKVAENVAKIDALSFD